MNDANERKGKRSDSVIWQKPNTNWQFQKAKCQEQKQNTTKNFDYTTIADRLRTDSWSNDIHTTGVVKPINGMSTFPLTAKAL